MKRIFTVFAAMGLLIAFESAEAQSIIIDSVSGTHFCDGDPVSVTFTVTGFWGHNNAFTLQLSNVSGTFENGFRNLGSDQDTTPSTLTIVSTVPESTSFSAHYRVRVIGASPYIESADNGSDILIGEKPSEVSHAPYPVGAAAVGVPIKISYGNSITSDDTEHIDFGAGATTDANGVIYHSSGLKMAHITWVAPGGCSVKDSFQIYVFGCEKPVIPHDAIVVSNSTIFTNNNESYKTFWLNPGVSLSLGDNVLDTIFAEAGSSVFGQNGGQSNDIVYLKKGASSDPDFGGVIVYQPGSSLDTTNGQEIRTVACPDLTFDYSDAPPNSVMAPFEGVTPTATVATMELSPNPTTGVITLEGIPAHSSITATNVMGQAVEELKASGTATLDLSKLARGAYYIRVESNGGVTTKRVIKQ